MTGEFTVLECLLGRLDAPGPGEVGAGDDAAVLSGGLVVAVDPVVEGVHFDRSLSCLDDAGWKALARNVSDVAAMGAVPWCCVASVVGANEDELRQLYDGLLAAADHWACPVVGGDLASGPGLVLTVTALGRLPAGAAPLLRSGARPGDGVYVSAPLGRGAAGLRLLRVGDQDGRGGIDLGSGSVGPPGTPQDPDGGGPVERVPVHPGTAASPQARAMRWYARPVPSVEAALAARVAGATAAIDISDGLAQDLDHLAVASGVGLCLDHVPVAAGATLDEALHGGDDYHLAFTAPDGDVPGIRIGTCTAEPAERTLAGQPFPVAGGWEHTL